MNFDSKDKCLQVSLYCFAKTYLFLYNSYDEIVFDDMVKSCRLDTHWPIKDPAYKWSNSGSENPKENTLWKRPTYWIYNKILKRFNIDPHKGLSIDQLRALFIVLYFNRHRKEYIDIWYNIFWGTIKRLGFAPSFTEHCLWKPQAFVLFLKSAPRSLKWVLYPLYIVSKFMFKRNLEREFMVPIKASTTNKISALPTAKMLDLPKIASDEYIREVYREYFKENLLGELIANALI